MALRSAFFLALTCALPWGGGDGSDAGAHPADRPDVDVRVTIDDAAVHFRIIMNLAFVDETIDAERESETQLHPVEYPALRAAAFDLFRESNRVVVDGVEVAPIDRGFDVETVDIRMLPMFPRIGMKGLIRVGLDLEYPVKTAPGRATLVWGPYPPDYVLETESGAPPIIVQAHLLAYGEDEVVTFAEHEPEFTWHRPDTSLEERFLPVPSMPEPATVTLPGGSILIVGAWFCVAVVQLLRRGKRAWSGLAWSMPVALAVAFVANGAMPWTVADPRGPRVSLPSADEAVAAFTPLHANIYRAFDYTAESEIYDALARSVEGDLLDDLYNSVYRGLIMAEEGGALSRVQRVDTLSADVESIGVLDDGAPGFVIASRWRVEGAVFHWGHSHYRTNEYHARYTVAGSEAGWRIRGHQPIEQRRLDTPQPGAGTEPERPRRNF